MTEFALNYSELAARLVREGAIRVDRFKCPAWPDLVARVQTEFPVYVHFGLRVGPGRGVAIDGETNQPADWSRVEQLLRATDTPYVNLHLAPTAGDWPGIPEEAAEPYRAREALERLSRDVRAVVERFGPERVVLENDWGEVDWFPRAACLPEVIRGVVQESGCGLLLDLAHARLAAQRLGVRPATYVSALPTARLREVHVSGVRRIGRAWVQRMERAGAGQPTIARYRGQLNDHLPLTASDWRFVSQSLDNVRAGAWGRPDLATLEYGGVGPLWEAVGEESSMVEQATRLYGLVRG